MRDIFVISLMPAFIDHLPADIHQKNQGKLGISFQMYWNTESKYEHITIQSAHQYPKYCKYIAIVCMHFLFIFGSFNPFANETEKASLASPTPKRQLLKNYEWPFHMIYLSLFYYMVKCNSECVHSHPAPKNPNSNGLNPFVWILNKIENREYLEFKYTYGYIQNIYIKPKIGLWYYFHIKSQ